MVSNYYENVFVVDANIFHNKQSNYLPPHPTLSHHSIASVSAYIILCLSVNRLPSNQPLSICVYIHLSTRTICTMYLMRLLIHPQSQAPIRNRARVSTIIRKHSRRTRGERRRTATCSSQLPHRCDDHLLYNKVSKDTILF